MSTVRIDVKDFGRYKQRLAERFMPAVRKGLVTGALRCVPIVHAAVRSAPGASPGGSSQGGAVNSGAYLRAWKAGATDDGARLYNDSSYAGVIEGGRRAGSKFPPKAAIARWAQRRLGLDEDEAKRAAFVIARAIARRGLVARKVSLNLQDKFRGVVGEEVQKVLSALLSGGHP